MVAGIPTSLRFIDLFYSMGVGVLCELAYSALCAVLGVGKRRLFAADLLLFLFSAIVLFSFSVTFSYTGCLRWYMAAGFLLGYWGALWLAAPLAARSALSYPAASGRSWKPAPTVPGCASTTAASPAVGSAQGV